MSARALVLLGLAAACAGCSGTGHRRRETFARPASRLTLLQAREDFIAFARRASVAWNVEEWAQVTEALVSPDGGSATLELAYAERPSEGAPARCDADLREIGFVALERTGVFSGRGRRRQWLRLEPAPCGLEWYFEDGDAASARRFGAAVERLARSTPGQAEAELAANTSAFDAGLWAHRADPRRALGEEALRRKAEAEAALQEGRLEDAERALAAAQSAAPWWPGAYFDRALVLAELGRLADAQAEMRRYLRLEPDAPESRVARERLAAWEEKRRAAPAPRTDPPPPAER